MDVIALQKIISAHVDTRLEGLEDAVGLLESRFPLLQEVGVGAQPCNTEFTTTGSGQPLTVTGFTNAYKDAETTAQRICNTGPCKKLVFKRYVKASRVAGTWMLEIAWECQDAGGGGSF